MWYVLCAKPFLTKAADHLDDAIARARTPDGIVSYYAHEAEGYREIAADCVEVTRFRQKPLPLFLEGFVHAVRVARPEEVRPLYDAVRRSALYDDALGMFRLNVPLGKDALDLGFYLSFSGILTFQNASALREIARTAPLDRVLIETDCPYLTPVPHRGKRNEPAFVTHVVTQLAAIRSDEAGMSPEKVALATTRNAKRLFKIA